MFLPKRNERITAASAWKAVGAKTVPHPLLPFLGVVSFLGVAVVTFDTGGSSVMPFSASSQAFLHPPSSLLHLSPLQRHTHSSFSLTHLVSHLVSSGLAQLSFKSLAARLYRLKPTEAVAEAVFDGVVVLLDVFDGVGFGCGCGLVTGFGVVDERGFVVPF